LFGEEPEKQRPAAPQDDGKTPSACPPQRRPHLECRECRIPVLTFCALVDLQKARITDVVEPHRKRIAGEKERNNFLNVIRKTNGSSRETLQFHNRAGELLEIFAE